jgi:RecB family exonuclease
MSGKIDRVDVRGGDAVVRDYKSGATVWPQARWEQDRRLQVALYMVAVRELLGLRPVGGFYVPLSGKEPRRPRGAFLKDADLGGGLLSGDGLEASELDDLLERARASVSDLAGEMRSGAVRPCPDTCSFRGGCRYPSICRSES